MKLHLIDDDEKLHKLLKVYFANEQIDLTASETPEKGLDFVKNNPTDLVILDLMLPGMNGFEVLKKLREENEDLPIIMLSAKGDNFNKIYGLELGSDDYMSKPFEPKELLARIKTILRRTEKNGKQKSQIIYSPLWDIQLDVNSRLVKLKGQIIDLTVTEFDLLKCFMQNAGIVQSRDTLMDRLKGIDFEAFDRSIDVHISRLRQKLGENPKKPEIIKTVWGVGYIFSRL